MPSSNGHVAFIWSTAERLRGAFKQHEYGSIILPLTLLRRLDQVLAPTRDKVLTEAAKYEGRRLNLDPILKRASGQLFYNASKLTLEKVLADPDHVATHLREYIAGFDPVVREIFEAFEFDATITRLEKVDRLYSVLGKFLDPALDLHPDNVPNDVMGDIFEELIRKFSEISNETAGEHFTPREVVRLCAELVLAGDDELFGTAGIVRSVYDPTCGTGGMLSVSEELVRAEYDRARLVLFGQELNPESWAVCRAEMLVKGQDPQRIAPDSTLAQDGHEKQTFDYMLANPPFGVDWTDDYDAVVAESEQRGFEGRFGAGYPRKNDGALLFLQHMLSKMKPPDQDRGSRIAIVFNASPLFSGEAERGPNNIRRWIVENDWLEAIVALPEQLFYNTGIGTYIWVLSNRKETRRQRKVQLIDARELWEPMPESLGEKRRRLSDMHISDVVALWRNCEANTSESKLMDNASFGYRRIEVARPLRLRYAVGDRVIEQFEATAAFTKFIASSNANETTGHALLSELRSVNGLTTPDREKMAEALQKAFTAAGKLPKPVRDAVWDVVSVPDPGAPEVRSADGALEAAPVVWKSQNVENVPLEEAVQAFIEREVKPDAPDAWLDDADVRVGYEFPVKGLFFTPSRPRPLDEIDAELQELESELRSFLEGGRL